MREYKFKVHLQGGNSLMFEHSLEEDIAAYALYERQTDDPPTIRFP